MGFHSYSSSAPVFNALLWPLDMLICKSWLLSRSNIMLESRSLWAGPGWPKLHVEDHHQWWELCLQLPTDQTAIFTAEETTSFVPQNDVWSLVHSGRTKFQVHGEITNANIPVVTKTCNSGAANDQVMLLKKNRKVNVCICYIYITVQRCNSVKQGQLRSFWLHLLVVISSTQKVVVLLIIRWKTTIFFSTNNGNFSRKKVSNTAS